MTEQRKYSLPETDSSIFRLFSCLQKVVFDREKLDRAGDRETDEYQTLLDLEKAYSLAILGEREIADDHFLRLVEPFVPDPPQEQWGSVVYGEESFSVPFTQAEIIDIDDARQAFIVLSRVKTGSGPERDFLSDTLLFPVPKKEDALSIGLNQRGAAVWGIFVTARAAEEALCLYSQTALEPQGEVREAFEKFRDLPDKLIRHC